MPRKIEVTDYCPEWTKMYKTEAKKIRAILGKNCIGIYHIGSTAVKGMPAKPIIDIMPIVKDISLTDALNGEFEALGYECRGEFGIPGRRFYAKGQEERTHHIHIFEQSNQADISRHLAVRDYLAAHPARAEEYGKLKRELAEKYTYDNDGYCDGKEAFMKELEQDALKWQERQNRSSANISLGLCFGCALGIIFGSLYGNTGMGLSMGLCFGLLVGTVFSSIGDNN